MRFGRLTVFDFKLFDIADKENDPDVVVVHHYNDEEDEKNDGPGDIFGSTGH